MGLNNFNGPPRNHEGVHPTIEGAYPEAKKTIREATINPSDFVHSPLYKKEGRESIEFDLKLVEEREKLFEYDDSQKPAEVLEAIMFYQGEVNNWFGQSAEIIKTSRYDDIFKGIDIIVGFGDTAVKETSRIDIGIDVTFGTTKLQEKFERIKNDINGGKRARVKYFYSEKEGMREPRDVSRVVVGVELNQVIELAALWLQQKNFKYKGMRGKANQMLAAHPVQRVILEEISLQLERFKDYANKKSKKELADIYGKDLAIVQNILKEKGNIKLSDELNNDKVFQGIRGNLMQF